MESIPGSFDKDGLISSFLEIAAGQSTDTALQFLQATSWKLEEALQLFYAGGEGGGLSSSLPPPVLETNITRETAVLIETVGQDVGDDDRIHAPLPIERETLQGDPSFIRPQPNSVVAFRNFEEESKQYAVRESDKSSSTTDQSSHDHHASLYRPPFPLMYTGPFDKAKVEASLQAKWLLVNLQSTVEFSSHMLNRDTWSNEALAQTIHTNFIFWQVYHDSVEGKKFCTYYSMASKIPAILVIDPITGQNLRQWTGMIPPDRLLEDLLPFIDRGPEDHHVLHPHKRPRKSIEKSTVKMPVGASEEDDFLMAVAASMEDMKVSIRSAAIQDVKGPIRATTTVDEQERKDDAETGSKVKLMCACTAVGASEEVDFLMEVAASMEDRSIRSAAIQDVKGPIRAATTVDEQERKDDAETGSDVKGPIRAATTVDEQERKDDSETGSNVNLTYPTLPEEPKGSRELLCRVGIRLPDGRRLQRNFLRTDPIKLLWSFCFPLVEEENRSFHFIEAIPRASKSLDYKSDLTFEEAGLSSSMISLIWD